MKKNLQKGFLKADFPIFIHHPNLVYLDNAATTQKPHMVIDRMNRFYAYENSPIHRGFYDLAEKATSAYESVRKQVAEFIGAEKNEIVFTPNATLGINLVAQSWARSNLRKGDEIVLTELEHHANLVPWLQLVQEIGVVIRYVPITINGDLDYTVLETIITQKTKLIAVTAISNVVGTEVNIPLLVQYGQRVGAKILVDACQAVARRKISVHDQNIDFLVFSGHKLLGPMGVGVLFVNTKLHGQMKPLWGGGGAIHSVDYDRVVWREVPACFEAGTPAVADVLGLGAALEYIKKNIDLTTLKEYEAALCSRLINGLQEFKNIKILGPIEQLKRSGHSVSFVIADSSGKGVHAHDVAAYLNVKNIAVRAGHHCAQPLHKKLGVDASVRVSFHGAYSSVEDVEKLLQTLKSL